jgi:glycosyltransferase involved in cell wall biosynthesis
MRISVALCAYQAERFLLEQLESIAAQSRLPDELVVCDDGSTDGTVAIIERFAANAAFPVTLHVNVTRLGSSRNFEQAIGHCQGDVIALSDHDDVWSPDKLARFAAAFSAPDEPGLVFSDGDFVDEHGHQIGGTCWNVGLGRGAVERLSIEDTFSVLLDWTIRLGGNVTGATMAFRACYRDLVLPFPEWMPRSGKGPLIHDAWIALLIGAAAPVKALPERLMRYRRHSAQQIGLNAAPARRRWRMKPRTSPPGGIPTSGEGRFVGLQAVRDRLTEHRSHYDVGRAVDILDDFLRHVHARERLPSSRVRRTAAIVRELRTGAYRRYSNGLASAARDLIARRPRAS